MKVRISVVFSLFLLVMFFCSGCAMKEGGGMSLLLPPFSVVNISQSQSATAQNQNTNNPTTTNTATNTDNDTITNTHTTTTGGGK